MKRSLSNPESFSPFKISSTPKKFVAKYIEEPPVGDCSLSPQGILELLTTAENLYTGNIHSTPLLIPSRSAVTGALSARALEVIDPDLLRAYTECIGGDSSHFYAHQVEAIESILVDRCSNVCISTSTSSGKSVAFNLPILSELFRTPSTTALYLYPTKALTQDQKRVIDSVLERRAEIGGGRKICVNILDGDVTDLKQRKEIMDASNLILTNPDMLHHYILPNSRKFMNFFSKLKFVLIDESHVYNGAFGSHVSSVIRRLRRVSAHYRKDDAITFIACSATIGNPAEHVARLVGLPCDALISTDGSPSGEKLLAVWDADKTVDTVVQILGIFLRNKIRAICFCKNRFMIELLLKQVFEKNENRDKIVAYRAGYSPEERRKLEERIFNGEVLVVVCTSALELGMDIGALDVAVSVGYPGSIHSLWQQWGRAGRGTRPSLSLLVAQSSDIVDSQVSRDSEQVLSLPPEDAVLQTDNPAIVKNHLICSDIELRIFDWEKETRFWDHCSQEIVRAAKKEAPFVKKSLNFSIRNIDTRKIACVDGETKIDELDITQALFAVFPGAIHVVQGAEYRIVELNLKSNVATAVKTTASYYTRAIDSSVVVPSIPAVKSKKFVFESRADVTLKIDSFWRISKTTNEKDGFPEPLTLPAIQFVTSCVWLELPTEEMQQLCWHGAMHALYFSACQRLLLSRQSDIKCACRGGKILIYDAQKGGLGISSMIFDRIEILTNLAIERIEKCFCENGCIKCLFISSCPNREISKPNALLLLKLIRLELARKNL